MLGSFYSQARRSTWRRKALLLPPRGIDKALEGEPIITWTCAVLKECLRSRGRRLTGKKDASFEGRSFTW